MEPKTAPNLGPQEQAGGVGVVFNTQETLDPQLVSAALNPLPQLHKDKQAKGHLSWD